MKPERFIIRAAGNGWICEARNGGFFSFGQIESTAESAMQSARAKFASEHDYAEPRKPGILLDLDDAPRASKSDLGSLLI